MTQLGGGEFFATNGLLFLPPEDLKRNLALLVQAEPLIHDLATDPSLRGLIAGLEDGLLGIQSNPSSSMTLHASSRWRRTPWKT